jgi:hypothetical protein
MSAARDDDLIIVIGRGQSGTRVLAHTLIASRVYMGAYVNDSGDKVPPEAMYKACKVLATRVKWRGGLSWDFGELATGPIDPEFVELVERYLIDLLRVKRAQKGWKLPETTLAYPWIVRMFPDARYVYIVRDPRDCLLGRHLTDDLAIANVPGPETEDILDRRVASWKYQCDIVAATPEPAKFTSLKYEDLVLDQEATLNGLEDFLGIPLARVLVDDSRVGLWREDPRMLDRVGPLEEHMRRWGYG